MRITRSSDWRDALRFDSPVVAADVIPGDPARCATCGRDSELLDRTRLWAVKHRHPHNPAGTVQLYCAAHAPRDPAPPPAERAPRAAVRAPRERRAPATRREPAPERVAAVCPSCFVEVPPTGVCGMCGERVG